MSTSHPQPTSLPDGGSASATPALARGSPAVAILREFSGAALVSKYVRDDGVDWRGIDSDDVTALLSGGEHLVLDVAQVLDELWPRVDVEHRRLIAAALLKATA